jgi:murein DD-endopeptidase MepM/ murein hydrolase activator NlpD
MDDGVAGTPTPAAAASPLDEARARADEATAALDRLQSEMAQLEADVATTEARVASITAELDAQRDKVEALLIAQYVQGAGPLEAPQSLDGAAAAARGEVMLDAVTGRSRDAVERFRAASVDLAAGQAHLAALRTDQQARAQQLAAQQAAAAAEVEALAEALRRSQAGRAERARGVSSFAISGEWACPVQGALSFTNDWGNARSGGRTHKGTDMLSPRGTPVVAPVDGVARQRTGGLGGLSVYVDGADGNQYYLAHLSSYAAAGTVSKGEVVGYVGNSGNAAGGPTHVHFQIHPNGGSPVNPYPTLAQHC